MKAKKEKEETVTETVTKTLDPDAIRLAVYNSFLSEYKKLISLIRAMPYPQEAFLQALMFFDTGVLWVKEAVYHVPFLLDDKVEEVEEVKEKVVV